MPDMEELWRKVKRMQGKEPFCYQSERYGHRDAAGDVAKEEGLQGEDLTAWKKFVDDKTRYMSNYTGD